MRRRTGGLAPVLATLLAAASLAACGGGRDGDGPAAHPRAAPASEEHVVVVEVATGWAAARAGVAPGDEVVAWRRGEAAGGPVAGPFDLRWLELEQAPRGAVTLELRRGGRRLDAELPAGGWRLTARPPLGDEHRALYRGARNAPPADAAEARLQLADALAQRGRREDAAWFRVQAVAPLVAAGEGDEAERQLAAAAEALADSPHRATALELSAEALARDRSRAAAARAALEEALELRRQQGHELALAADLSSLARLAAFGGRLDDARERVERCLELRRRLAPGSVAEAQAVNARAVVAGLAGETPASREGFREALRMFAAAAPESPERAAAENNLGLTARRTGDLRGAREHLERARAVLEVVDPDGERLAEVLNNLGVVARVRGRLDTAERHWTRALEIRRRRAPHSLELVGSLGNLGNLAYHQGRLDRAEAIHRETLELLEASAPGSLRHAKNLHSLANVVRDRGELEEASALYRRALELTAGHSEHSNLRATLLLSWAELELRRDEPERAAELADRGRALFRRIAPDGLDLAAALDLRARSEARRGDDDDARRHHERALAIRSRLAPGSAAEVDSLAALAALARRRGEPATARELYRRAVDALETQRSRLGGTEEVRARFAERYSGLYHAYLELLLDAGEPAAAFHLLERYRARSLLHLLAQRDLAPDAGLPPGLAQRRAELRRAHQRARAALAATRVDGASDEAALARQRRRMEDLQRRREALRAELLRTAPRRAALEEPRPLTADEVAARLPAGTLLLSYAVGEDAGTVLALPAGGAVSAHRLEVSRDALRHEVDAFRRLLQNPIPSAATDRALDERGRRLARWLLAPVAAPLAAADRLLVLPDGPLHTLPFAALPTVGVAGLAGPWLVQDLPLSTAVSASVWSELAAGDGGSPEARPGRRLVALGDPQRQAAQAAAARGGAPALGPLPFARLEVLALAAHFGERRAADVAPPVVLLGAEAGERQVKELGTAPSYLHLACHARVDPRYPLDSFLALSSGGPDDGLLRAWEVFEEVRLDGAELVTLSACDSGLGAEIGGEGMVGLTHAFHYAGARAVLASLWPVSDRSTAALMSRVYRHLAAGLSPDVALRAAQTELVRGPVPVPTAGGGSLLAPLVRWLPTARSGGARVDATRPYHWAAFQIHGAGLRASAPAP